MHVHSLEHLRHQHVFLGDRHVRHERRTWLVVALTAVTMIVEIIAGTVFGSMALVADGWHMSTHAAALAIAAFAYRFARKHAHDPRFTFGTGKLGELAGFASAIVLLLVALAIGYESLQRLWFPVAIRINEAIAIAAIGLAVNLACAWLLRDQHDHAHGHAHRPHGHQRRGSDHHDTNFRAAYVHVLADALTSVLAIVALLAASFGGWFWMDAAVGLIGAAVIAVWSAGLIRTSSAMLLDMVTEPALAAQIKERLEVQGDRLSDLHLWQVGPGHAAVIASVVTDHPRDPSVYKSRLDDLDELSHVTVEVHRCADHCAGGAGPR